MVPPSWKQVRGVLALLITLAGGTLVLRAWLVQPSREVELGGLRLRLERAVWMHEPTDHGDTARLPTSEGAPGPGPGQRRLVVEVTVFNPGRTPRDFEPGELRLAEAARGTVWQPSAGGRGVFTLRPAELLPVTLSFDVPATQEPVRLEWERDTRREALLLTQRPSSPGESGEQAGWPLRVEQLPPGREAAGSALFHGRLACTSCHGDLARPEGPRIAPFLGDFARVGATRVAGKSAAQYAYESLLDPNAFIPPECAERQPCARPTLMPLYGESLSLQEMADLVSYLMGLRGGG
ncbi:c-type cytochrome [Archangium violaceum]|uniref:c-type cytochrome n=1 Tax=Archangium violaceum TaxID=83451 RepID=UPI00194E465C|nr:c-type cytochrome [Archangium violaceum]QRN95978.1 c-type cytochrome [Archangium violaceum]